MTISDACKMYGIGRTKIYFYIAEGRIDARKVGARTLVIADSVEKFLASLPKLNAA
jgi:excisionase family DNA binding protein